jgi:hypothetical protein
MGNLRACFAVATLALAACGSESKQPDAGIILVDSPNPDAKVWNDAPPKNYDLTCLNGTVPTTAPATISVSGTTQEFGTGGGSELGGVAVSVFKRSDQNASLATDTSDTATATLGEFQLTNIATGNAPIDGYIEAIAPLVSNAVTHRTTYMFPPTVVDADLADVPVVMISNSTFQQFQIIEAQDDTVNGALVFLVTDCASMLIGEATATVEQGGQSEGTTVHLGAFMPQLAGIWVSLNVPHGETQIKVSYNGMNFPTRNVFAFKKDAVTDPGTITFTAVRPGP